MIEIRKLEAREKVVWKVVADKVNECLDVLSKFDDRLTELENRVHTLESVTQEHIYPNKEVK